ncbi:MAG: hypothetical protein BWY94_02387 [Actinobacteria bacterium ADurb.BinA094]|nr:MAG: hypothetical protein BWY94_02387 [Actinobacteria bacterium ADurb.BinA094]
MTPNTAIRTTPSVTAGRKPRASVTQAAGMASGMKAIMNDIERTPMARVETP